MMGRVTSSGRVGIQAKIRDHVPLASYVHCNGHCLNMATSETYDIPAVRKMINKLKNCCLLTIQNSLKRNEL